MRKQIYSVSMALVMAGTLGFIVGCNQKAADKDPAKPANQGQPTSRIVENVDLTPGKSIAPQDQAKVSSMAMKALVHISKAQQEIVAKNVDEAKKDVAQAASLMAILKEVLPTVKIIDHIQVAKTNLSYVGTTEVPQDLVTIMSSLDQLYDVLPEGKAKEHAKQAKEALTKDKEKGAAKAKESLEAVEESLDFRQVDLSVSHVSRWVKLAQEYLGKGETKEAGEALTVALDGVTFVDFDVVDPASRAAREIWLATQDWAAKSPKATKTRLEKAKAALQERRQERKQEPAGPSPTPDWHDRCDRRREGRGRNRKGPSRVVARRKEAGHRRTRPKEELRPIPSRVKHQSAATTCAEESMTAGRIATMPKHPKSDGRCVSCEVGDGLPTAKGKAHSYYMSREDGRRMLVVERRSGDRLRINGAAEVVILEVHPDMVKLAIEGLPDDGAKS